MPITEWLGSQLFGLVHGHNLVYNTCWEDPRLDRVALRLTPADRLMVITGAGCNALDYALAAPARIDAVDVNPRQNALLELKLAGIKALDFDTFFQMFGRGRLPGIESVYREKLRPASVGLAAALLGPQDRLFRRPPCLSISAAPRAPSPGC